MNKNNTDIVELYIKYNDFEKAVKLSGLPTLTAHIKLLSSGVITLKDKISFSSKSGKLGALAEKEFQRLVPEAVNYNTVVQKNNPIFDFKYGDLTVDVKYSSMLNRKGYKYWSVRASKSDIMVCFLEVKKGNKLKNADILVIPQGFINTKQNIHISPKKELYSYCKVESKELKNVLAEYNGTI